MLLLLENQVKLAAFNDPRDVDLSAAKKSSECFAACNKEGFQTPFGTTLDATHRSCTINSQACPACLLTLDDLVHANKQCIKLTFFHHHP
jgi:hypothetical protein